MKVANGQELLWVNRNDIFDYNIYTNLSVIQLGQMSVGLPKKNYFKL